MNRSNYHLWSGRYDRKQESGFDRNARRRQEHGGCFAGNKALKMPYVDTDLLIQRQENSYLQELIEKNGIGGFIKIEERVVMELDLTNQVIATGWQRDILAELP
jgi:hypothetical protein